MKLQRQPMFSGKACFVIIVAAFVLQVVLLWTTAPVFAETGESPSEILAKIGDAMADVAEKAQHGVVNISTTKTVNAPANPLLEDPFFRRFFGEGRRQPESRKVTNLGSGVMASSDGYILTNNHVIEGAEDILVKLSDNREYKGKVVGMDSRTDIAVIKIEEKNLPTINWGDSDKLRVGEIVIAVGNPFGLSKTITMGIISALSRSGMGITDYEDFIQTDAAINPGNSGGALVNIKGELIGINTAILSRSGGFQGIGFAIPSNMVKNVMDGIINGGKVVRGWLGVQVQPLTRDLAKQFKLKDENGVLIVDIVEGSPAEKGGLKRGDVITEFNGRKVENPFHLKNTVASAKPGDTLKMMIIRDGNVLTATVVIGELPSAKEAVPAPVLENSLKGVSVQELTEDYLRKMNITKKLKGVVVTAIEPGSPAQGILSKGDIILELNRQLITGINDYRSVVAGIEKKQDILILLIRDSVSRYVTIPGVEK
jgi:serine protease Do